MPYALSVAGHSLNDSALRHAAKAYKNQATPIFMTSQIQTDMLEAAAKQVCLDTHSLTCSCLHAASGLRANCVNLRCISDSPAGNLVLNASLQAGTQWID